MVRGHRDGDRHAIPRFSRSGSWSLQLSTGALARQLSGSRRCDLWLRAAAAVRSNMEGIDRSSKTPIDGLYLASSYAGSGGFTGAILAGSGAARPHSERTGQVRQPDRDLSGRNSFQLRTIASATKLTILWETDDCRSRWPPASWRRCVPPMLMSSRAQVRTRTAPQIRAEPIDSPSEQRPADDVADGHRREAGQERGPSGLGGGPAGPCRAATERVAGPACLIRSPRE